MFKASDYTWTRYSVRVGDSGMIHFIKKVIIYDEEEGEEISPHIIETEVRKCEAAEHIDSEDIAYALRKRKRILMNMYGGDPELPEDLADLASKVREHLRTKRTIVATSRLGRSTTNKLKAIVADCLNGSYELVMSHRKDGAVTMYDTYNSIKLYYTDQYGRTVTIGEVKYRAELMPRRKYEDRQWVLVAE